MKCSDISSRQQNLLMQCYCKTLYNTNFYKYIPEDQTVVCTRGDTHNLYGNTTEICEDYQKYSGCKGVDIGPNSAHPTVS
ncbi:hypothetical protein GGI12_002985, partial [Dipsacomyces acuminosporus]